VKPNPRLATLTPTKLGPDARDRPAFLLKRLLYTCVEPVQVESPSPENFFFLPADVARIPSTQIRFRCFSVTSKNTQTSAGSSSVGSNTAVMTAQEFGQRVYRLRMAKKWSQNVCSDRAGISVRTLQMIESYSLKRPTIETTRKLAVVFKCSWDDLLGKP
jgi:DNA-binding XRE family transcriptional regulator